MKVLTRVVAHRPPSEGDGMLWVAKRGLEADRTPAVLNECLAYEDASKVSSTAFCRSRIPWWVGSVLRLLYHAPRPFTLAVRRHRVVVELLESTGGRMSQGGLPVTPGAFYRQLLRPQKLVAARELLIAVRYLMHVVDDAHSEPCPTGCQAEPAEGFAGKAAGRSGPPDDPDLD